MREERLEKNGGQEDEEGKVRKGEGKKIGKGGRLSERGKVRKE